MGEDIGTVSAAGIWDKEKLPQGESRAWVQGLAKSVLWREYLRWKEALNLPQGANAIEAGCGYGKFSMAMGLCGDRVTLLDNNRTALDSALEMHRSLGLRPEHVFCSLLGADAALAGRFDVSCSFGVLEHFKGDERLRAFGSCAGLLRKGGMLFFTVPNGASIFYRTALGLRRMAGSVPAGLYERAYSRTELRNIAARSGVEVLAVEGICTISDDFGYWIWGNATSFVRRAFGMKPRRPVAETGPDTDDIDMSGASIKDRRGALDRIFSSELLFVGVKK